MFHRMEEIVMTYKFKITTWEGHEAIQIKTALGSLYLDAEDVKKLKEHLMKDVIAGLEKAKSENRINGNVWTNGYDDALKLAIALIRDGVK